jgi:hypothetical protein
MVWLAMLCMGGVAAAIGGFVGGLAAGLKASGPVVLLVWDGVVFLFFMTWVIGLMVEIQRSESVDLTKLMHLPVKLSQAFVFNYFVSHLTPSLVVMLPGILALSIGMALAGGFRFALLPLLALGFVFCVTAWTYCLRGWLAALMINKRRRRAVLVWLSVGMVLMGQLPNIVNSVFFSRARRLNAQPANPAPGGAASGESKVNNFLPATFVRVHAFIPICWPGIAALKMKDGYVGAPAAATGAFWVLGALGLMRAYRMTIRFYQGADGGEGARAFAPRSPPATRRMLVEREMPWLDEETAALALATLRSHLRAPEVKMAIIVPIVVAAAVSSGIFINLRHGLDVNAYAWISCPLALIAAVSFALLAGAGIMGNQFGQDRDGFRGLMLLPARRERILFAKNLAFVPFVMAAMLVNLVLVWFFLRPAWNVLLTGILQAPTAILLSAPLFNLTSILVPYRMATGTLQAKKPKAVVLLAVFGLMFAAPMALSPLLIAPGVGVLFGRMGWLPGVPVDLLLAAVTLAAAALIYRLLLPAEGRLLHRREQAILREVTEETE